MGRFYLAAAMVLAANGPAMATVWTATPGNVDSIFAQAVAGDSITLKGYFTGLWLRDRDWTASPVRVSAWNATFTGTVNLRGVKGLVWRGGQYRVATATDRAISLYDAGRITFDGLQLRGSGLGGQGLIAQVSSDISVKNGSYSGIKLGVGYVDVTRGAISGNVFTAMTSDGINIAGSSSQISATANSCSAFAPTPGAHPDCIQMWSTIGKPQLQLITVSGNTVSGATQGITLFDNGGKQITIANNRVDTSYPQGIACFLCDNSSITGNVVTTQAGAIWRTSINATGNNLTISGNSVGPLAVAAGGAAMLAEEIEPLLAGGGNAAAAVSDWTGDAPLAARGYGGIISDVPEPLVWTQLIAGFGLAGAMARRRRAVRPAAA